MLTSNLSLNKFGTVTISLVKNLFWRFSGFLLRLLERKDFGSFQAPVLKLSKKCLVSLAAAKKSLAATNNCFRKLIG